jgi:hypothetical protein
LVPGQEHVAVCRRGSISQMPRFMSAQRITERPAFHSQ